MKKDKGFTLIELLAVIVILAIIMVIATTQVNKVIKKAKVDSNEINKKSIAKAAETCLAQENDETKCNMVDKLVENGYLEEFKDPYTKSGEYVSQNYPISFNDHGKAIVSYFGEGYIEQISKDIKEKEYFTWNGSTITGLTNEGFNWVKDNDWTLVIPSNAKKIDTDFSNSRFCTTSNLKKTVIIPGNVKTIGHGSFVSCNITSLFLNSGIEVIENDAFYRNKISYLKIPNSSIEVGRGSFSQNELPDNQAFIYKRTKTGIDNTILVAYGGKKKSDVVIPENVEVIYDYAFYVGNIYSITLPNNLKRIGSGAFLDNELTNVIIPDSVTYIGNFAFGGNKLNELDVSNVQTIGSGYVTANNFPKDKAIIYDKNDSSVVISYASRGSEVIIPEGVKKISRNSFTYSGVTNVILPNSLERIEANAFSVTPLKSIIIPKNVNNIGGNAFYSCNRLTSIYISNQNPNKETLKANWKSYGLKSDIISFID